MQKRKHNHTDRGIGIENIKLRGTTEYRKGAHNSNLKQTTRKTKKKKKAQRNVYMMKSSETTSKDNTKHKRKTKER